MNRSPQQREEQPTRTIVGCYARFSSDRQTDASIDSQVHECKDCSTEKGWRFDPALVFSDAGISGETLETRTGLTSLLKIVENGIPPFSGIVVDDTSRLGRRVSDVLRICEIFKFHGVFLYFVNAELDSRDPQFERLIIEYASEDQQFLHKLRHAVRRGMKDRARKGMNPGGFRYGYSTEPVPDPTRRGTIARPAVKGMKMLIDHEEGPAVKQIYLWAREGLSFSEICKRCTTAKFPPPGRRFGGGRWTPDNVGIILHNPIYKGRLEWGRTRQAKHPTTGKTVAKPVPEEEWTVELYPELAIVSNELWDEVQATIATHWQFGLSKLGGMAKKSGDHVPLLIGILTCGSCGGPIVSCASTKKDGRILACKNHKHKNEFSKAQKECSNAHSISEAVLEQSVLEKLIQEVLNPASIEFALSEFYRKLTEETEKQIKESEKKRENSQNLDGQLRQLEVSIRHIVDSLRDYGPSKPLLDELANLEGRGIILRNQKEKQNPEPAVASFEEAREFFLAMTQNLASILLGNRLAAREALLGHIDRLILIPELQNGVPVYRIKGAFRPLASSADVTPSTAESKGLRHYKEFSIMFELIVQARTCKKDYLAHPSCPSERVKCLIEQGLTIRQIAQELNSTTFIVQRVLRSLELQPSRIDYLSHPKCPPETLLEGRRRGKSYKVIASELGISLNTVMAVKRALVASGVKVPNLENPSSISQQVDYLNYPNCPAADVVRLRTAGRTMAEIASEFGVSTPIISRIIHAVQTSTGSMIEPIPGMPRVHRFPHRDYLNHPACPTAEVARLQALGRTIDEIAIGLRISRETASLVSQAMRDPSKRYRALRSFDSNRTPILPTGSGELAEGAPRSLQENSF